MPSSGPLPAASAVALWPLALAAGLLPAVAGLVAWQLATALELIPACNPFIDGCVSISRAARHGLPNHVFRALIVPAAVLQAATWYLCALWLRDLGVAGRPRLLAAAGAVAGLFLVLYGTFLGTEGDAYRWMRRFGIVLYFGFTTICLIVAAGLLARAGAQERGLGPAGARVLIALCWALLALGVASALSPLFLADAGARDRFTNVLEWYGAAIFSVFFVVLAQAWRRTRYVARLGSRR